jgi:hypothetical protein
MMPGVGHTRASGHWHLPGRLITTAANGSVSSEKE